MGEADELVRTIAQVSRANDVVCRKAHRKEAVLIEVYGLCQHCQTRAARRPRKLCSRCYDNVRNLYPSTSKFARRSTVGVPVIGFSDKRLVPARYPTRALPGTEEKLRVLIERASSGQHLWHPDDSTFGGE